MTNLITEHINVWTSAQIPKANGGRGRGKGSANKSSHGIKKLRELILELAVRGKLVPQDPNDESASVLLDKIAKEKKRLIKEGKIKKQKPLPEINEGEKPFNLPKKWEWARLGDIGNIFNGNSISARIKEEKYTNIDGWLPFIATKDVGYGWDSLSYNNGISIPLNEPKYKIAHKGAVLICAEGGSAGKKCGITDQDICFGNKLFANELYGKIESDFILANYLSPSFFAQFSEKMTGIIGGISAAKFSQLIVPIPPLPEQHRIVAKVDELMALCDWLEQEHSDSNAAHQTLVDTLLGTLTSAADQAEFAEAWQRIASHFETLFTTEHSIDKLIQTILQLAVDGRLLRFSTGANKYIIKDLLSFGPRNGLSPTESPHKTEVKVLKLGATTKGVLDLNESKYVDVDIDSNSHLWLQQGDILIQRGNAAQYVGCNVVVKSKSANYIYPDLMMKLRVNNKVSPQYLSLCLSASSSREYMWLRMTGTSGTMPKISKKVVESLPVLVPDLDTQNNVLCLVDKLLEYIDSIRRSIADAQTIQIQLADAIVEQAVV